ncbi:nephrocystin-3-like [Corticium candelabrum]|uniref:nephrocystin-3-like n=1 Tax=Corticium candelabrum TaxID=121492 RepID=UPI002E25A308|nr:nephrocystin-3-like [Corticium candelabrum]
MLQESVPYFEESIKVHQSYSCQLQELLAEAHYYLGAASDKAGNWAKSEDSFRSSLSISAKMVGEPPYRVPALRGLAFCLFKQKQFAVCLPMFLEIRDTCSRRQSPMSQVMALVSLNIGVCYWKLKQPRKAEAAFLESLEIFRAVVPTGSINMSTAYKTVGSFYQETGNLREAEEMYRQRVLILEQTAPGHILNAAALNSLAICLYKQSKFSTMESLLWKARHILTEVLPNSEPMITVCNYLGACYVKLNRLSEAEEALFECLRLCKAIKRPGDPFTSGTVRTLVHLGSLYEEKGDFRKAMELYEHSLNTLQQMPLIYDDTTDVLTKAVLCLFNQQKLVEMLPFLLTLRELHAQQAPVSVAMVETCNLIGEIYMILQYWKEAEEAFSQSLEISQYVFPHGHADINIIERRLHDVRQRLY